ncbi:MAG: DUF2147 domain-containing protein [Bacteroidota bacterium]|nr:DUF2147 domain-containing protein [Bacteroidota bacterium]
MKTILTITLVLTSFTLFAQTDALVGKWYNNEKDAVISISKTEKNTFDGHIIWMKFPNDENGKPKVDNLNPKKSLQTRPRLGLKIMYDFKFDADNKWTEGQIYDPKSGNTYNGSITLSSTNTLDLRGYVGLPIFGRTSTWTRKLD